MMNGWVRLDKWGRDGLGWINDERLGWINGEGIGWVG